MGQFGLLIGRLEVALDRPPGSGGHCQPGQRRPARAGRDVVGVAGRVASLARDAIEEQAGLTEPVEIEEVGGPCRGLAVVRGGPVSVAHGDGGMVPARKSDDEIGIEPSAELDDLDFLSAERVMGMGDGHESRRGLGGRGSVLGAFRSPVDVAYLPVWG
jgi:hypothetical protein